MSFVFEGGTLPNRYVYLGKSYRNKEKKSVTKRAIVGKVEPNLGIRIFKPNFFEEKEIKGIPITDDVRSKELSTMVENAKKVINMPYNDKAKISRETISILNEILSLYGKEEPKDSMNISNTDINENTVVSLPLIEIIKSIKKSFGAFYLFDGISEHLKLKNAIQTAFPADWKEIFMLSTYLVSTGDPMMYCQNWINKTEGLPAILTSPTISKLMSSFDEDQINYFYSLWGKLRSEVELLALDITSISSYSEHIGMNELGFNKEHSPLKQINACLLFGQTSRLPVYFKPYSGSLKDVSTLNSTLGSIYSLGHHKLSLVMDKGFASIKNINEMLSGPLQSNFIISLPFTLSYVERVIYLVSNSILNYENVIQSADNTWGKMIKDTWNGSEVFVHAYLNRQKNTEIHHRIHSRAKELLEKVKKDGYNKKDEKLLKKFLDVSFNKDGELLCKVNDDKINQLTMKSGWFILLSNFISDTKEALHLYRTKDVVEKGFFRLQSQLDLRRLRGHSDKSAESKLLISFISLIILSYIHKIMLDNDLFKNYTIKSLIMEMEKLNVTHINNSRFLEPISASQKKILKLFNLKEPHIFEIDPSTFFIQ
jgi:transposase